MFIQTEETPNPATMKFLPGRDVLPGGSVDYRSEQEAGKSPLAQALFNVDGVVGVFLADDFVTVAKRDDKDWHLMKPGILGVIMEHFTSGDPVMRTAAGPAHAAGDGQNDEVVSPDRRAPGHTCTSGCGHGWWRYRVPRI